MGIMRVYRFFFLFFLVSVLGFSQDANQNLESSSVIEFVEHKVKRKQTLYTISSLYNVPIDLIKKYNPSIKGDKISKKMVLKIPFITTVVLEEFIKETVEKVLVSTRVNQNLLDSIPKKNSVKFGFIAPFNLNKIEIDSIENTKKYLEKLNLSTLSLDFYSGVLTALETAKTPVNIAAMVGDITAPRTMDDIRESEVGKFYADVIEKVTPEFKEEVKEE